MICDHAWKITLHLEFDVHIMYVSKCAFCLVFTWWHVCINYAYFCYIHRIIIWCHDIVSSHNITYIVYITDVMQWHSVMTSYNDSMNITKMSIVNAKHTTMCTLSGMHIVEHTWYGHQTLVAKWFFRHNCISIPIFYKKLWAIQKNCRSAVIHFSCNQNCHLWQFVPPQRNSFWCSTTSYLSWGCMLPHSQVITKTKSRLTPMSRTFVCHCI